MGRQPSSWRLVSTNLCASLTETHLEPELTLVPEQTKRYITYGNY